MRFTYECDGMDGLIMVDKQYLEEIDETLLYELDIFLDRYGKSELVYDFPDEKWEDVREREKKDLIELFKIKNSNIPLGDSGQSKWDV